MIFSLDQVLNLLAHYQYLILFPIVVIEGPIATVIAGLAIALGTMNFFIAYIVITLGDVTGDVIYYAIGRWGREGFLEKWGKYLGIPPQKVVPLEKHFEKHGGKTLLIGKLAHGIGAVFLVAAGLVRMPLSKFITANFGATLIKSLLLLLAGYYFGTAVVKINSFLEFFAAFSIGAGIIIFIVGFYYYSKKHPETYE